VNPARHGRTLNGMKRRWLGCVFGILAGGAMAVPLGPTSTQRAVDQMNSSSMRGVPTPPPAAQAAARPNAVWVPDRFVSAPGAPAGVFEPGHWVMYTPEGQRIAPPPLRPDVIESP
jgi:hypothetical protein